MKKIVIFLSFILLFSTLNSQTIKFYQNDESIKQYDVEDIEYLSFTEIQSEYELKIFRSDSIVGNYSTSEIDSMVFEQEKEVVRHLVIYHIDSGIMKHWLVEIDSIVFSKVDLAPPSIASIEPTAAVIGEEITLTGENFGATKSESSITFSGVIAEEISNWTNNEIKLIVPTGAQTGDVKIVVNDFESNSVGFSVIPHIFEIIPEIVNKRDTIRILGTGFGHTQYSSEIVFNEILTNEVITWTDNEITLQVPDGCKSGSLSVMKDSFSSNEMIITFFPHIDNVAPDWFKEGDEIIITGSNFGTNMQNSWLEFNELNPQPQDYIHWTDSEIKVKAPIGVEPGEVYVVAVENRSNGMDYHILPLISFLEPPESERGEDIIINGNNFGEYTDECYVSFNELETAVFPDYWSDTKIRVKVPTLAETGKVTVTVQGHKSNEVDFNIIEVLSIISITPEAARIEDIITIKGKQFGSSQGSSYDTFAGTNATEYSQWTDSQIRAKIPTNAVSGKLTVTVNDEESNEVDYSVVPQITTITPTSGEVGSTITISGNGFGDNTNDREIQFYNAQTSSDDCLSWSTTQIRLQVPEGAKTGNITVIVDEHQSNGINFTVNQPNPNEVTIGSQVWMRKNLDVTTYRNGDPIPQVTDPNVWDTLTTGAWCYYNNDAGNNSTYGKLYNWYAVNDSRGLAPSGWHVPTDSEWSTLSSYLGGDVNAGGKMKEVGLTHWQSPNTGATNTSGFTGLPGGMRFDGGAFQSIGSKGRWWTATEKSAQYAKNIYLEFDSIMFNKSFIDGNYKKYGYSIRCIKD